MEPGTLIKHPEDGQVCRVTMVTSTHVFMSRDGEALHPILRKAAEKAEVIEQQYKLDLEDAA